MPTARFLATAMAVMLTAGACHADITSDLIAHYSFNGHLMDIS